MNVLNVLTCSWIAFRNSSFSSSNEYLYLFMDSLQELPLFLQWWMSLPVHGQPSETPVLTCSWTAFRNSSSSSSECPYLFMDSLQELQFLPVHGQPSGTQVLPPVFDVYSQHQCVAESHCRDPKQIGIIYQLIVIDILFFI